ncbi:MAG: cytochrome c oxidase subunit 3 [Wenzhouxiangellaceae bacterium]|nr:cytochrome c oxidase subunit 3 [Wenzhouxiangellaceae bacterium]
MSERPEALRFQFEDLDQQRAADEFGMWVFLLTEVLFFGALFLVYAVARWNHPEAFIDGSHLLNATLGTVNTAILLTSSLAIAVADLAVREDARRLARWMLSATLLLGLAFLAVKGYEYLLEYRHHRVPFLDRPFEWPGPDAREGRLFFNLYFAMTGLHALHLVVGCGLVCAMLWLNERSRLPARLTAQVRAAGLYWHFVDVVWVFLFPLLYLVR